MGFDHECLQSTFQWIIPYPGREPNAQVSDLWPSVLVTGNLFIRAEALDSHFLFEPNFYQDKSLIFTKISHCVSLTWNKTLSLSVSAKAGHRGSNITKHRKKQKQHITCRSEKRSADLEGWWEKLAVGNTHMQPGGGESDSGCMGQGLHRSTSGFSRSSTW
jgi:hypothetical protein